MSITWTVPSALWLLLAVPLVWIALRFGRTNFNPRQRRVQAVLRSRVSLNRRRVAHGTHTVIRRCHVTHSARASTNAMTTP